MTTKNAASHLIQYRTLDREIAESTERRWILKGLRDRRLYILRIHGDFFGVP